MTLALYLITLRNVLAPQARAARDERRRMNLTEIAIFARQRDASFHLSWTSSGYRAAFVSRDGTGEIATTRDAAEDAARLAVQLVETYTLPDGTIEWSRRQEAYDRGRKLGERDGD